MDDSWESGDPYERFMGRWSRQIGDRFVYWLSAPLGLKWIDVGCGTGALSEAILTRQQPQKMIAIDHSEDFVRSAQQRLGMDAQCMKALASPMQMQSDWNDCLAKADC